MILENETIDLSKGWVSKQNNFALNMCIQDDQDCLENCTSLIFFGLHQK